MEKKKYMNNNKIKRNSPATRHRITCSRRCAFDGVFGIYDIILNFPRMALWKALSLSVQNFRFSRFCTFPFCFVSLPCFRGSVWQTEYDYTPNEGRIRQNTDTHGGGFSSQYENAKKNNNSWTDMRYAKRDENDFFVFHIYMYEILRKRCVRMRTSESKKKHVWFVAKLTKNWLHSGCLAWLLANMREPAAEHRERERERKIERRRRAQRCCIAVAAEPIVTIHSFDS